MIEWVSTKKKQPKPGVRVLVWDNDGVGEGFVLPRNGKFAWFIAEGWPVLDPPSHWAPLNKPRGVK